MLKIRVWLTLIFFTVLPFQTRWIYSDSPFSPDAEWGRQSLYVSELVLGALIILALAHAWKNRSVLKKEAKKRKTWWHVAAVVLMLYLLRYVLFYGFISAQVITWLGFSTIAAVFVYLDWMPRSAALRGAFAGIALAALLGIFQFVDQSVVANKWLGIASAVPQEGGAAVIENEHGRFLRAYGPSPHPNIFGGYMALALVLALCAWQKPKVCKKKLGAFVIAISVALILSFSRGAWLAAAVGIGMAALKHKKKLAYPLLLATLPMLITVAATWPLVETRLGGTQRLEERSLQERSDSLKDGLVLLQDHPLTGVGLGMSALVLGENMDDRWWMIAPPHNVVLVMALEVGLFGLLLIGLVLSPLAKKYEFYVVAVPLLTAGMFDHYLWTFYPGIMLVGLSAAIILALSPRRPHLLNS